MLAILEETPVGQSLMTFWRRMPYWVLGNVLCSSILLMIVSLQDEMLRLPLLWLVVPVLLTFLVWLVQQEMYPDSPSVKAIFKSHLPVSFSIVMAYTLVLLIPQGGLSYMGIVLLSTIAPFALSLPSRFSRNPLVAWQNAFLMAVHFPIYGLGLAAVAGWFFVMALLTHGGLLLVVPTLWLALATRTTQELIEKFEQPAHVNESAVRT